MCTQVHMCTHATHTYSILSPILFSEITSDVGLHSYFHCNNRLCLLRPVEEMPSLPTGNAELRKCHACGQTKRHRVGNLETGEVPLPPLQSASAPPLTSAAKMTPCPAFTPRGRQEESTVMGVHGLRPFPCTDIPIACFLDHSPT